jgi:hypothetical protein
MFDALSSAGVVLPVQRPHRSICMDAAVAAALVDPAGGVALVRHDSLASLAFEA